MITPGLPHNEDLRLQSLHALEILDTPAEERFDRITRMAIRLFDVPVAMVSLLDEKRQWLKSCAGMPVFELPRKITFCAHAILGDEVFVVPDMHEDERFKDNPLVLEQNVRFYAGCPLKAMNGTNLGTICVVDTKPRNFSEEDKASLRDLAGIVERELLAVQLATEDELTRILNRRGFFIQGEHDLSLAMRQNLNVSLAYLDLDGFKKINDEYGHAEGDRVLIKFSEILKQSLRDSDTLGRIGGDEFVLLLTDATLASSQTIIEKFQKILNAYNHVEKRGYDISFSHGVVEFDPKQHTSLEDLLKAGDVLMYTQKKAKKGPSRT